MTVSITSCVNTSPTSFRVVWSSDLATPTYRVYVDGALAYTTTATEGVFSAAGGVYPVIEIRDDALAPASAHPPRVTLQWARVAEAAEYRIYEYVGGAWALRAVVPETGLGYYRWRSRILEDETEHSFRVTPIDATGNAATPTEWTMLMVRTPDVPDVTMTAGEKQRVVDGSGNPVVDGSGNEVYAPVGVVITEA